MRALTTLLTIAIIAAATNPAVGNTALRNICRVKGQEGNVLRGLGLVVGLNGTGDAGDGPTMRALARSMEIMGSPVPQAVLTASNRNELDKIKNVALVMVTAHVPPTGARRGDRLDCNVLGITGKSLQGGRLAFAALQGPLTQDKRIYALCEGAIRIENAGQPLNGKVHDGCQMEEDIFTPFEKGGRITLIVDRNHANFYTASEIGDSIRARFWPEDESGVLVVNAANIVVEIPDEYSSNQVGFLADVLDTKVYFPEPEARVVINSQTGAIVINGDVTIGDVVVSHRDVVVEAAKTEQKAYKKIDLDRSDMTKLDALVTALDSLKVPNSDVIEIIKGIERAGKLHGRLIVE